MRFWIPNPNSNWLLQTLADPVEDSCQKEDHPDKDDACDYLSYLSKFIINI